MIRCFRVVLTTVLTVAAFAGCGGLQLPIGAQGAMPQGPASTSYKSLYSFGAGPDGQEPKAALVSVKGTLYGTTYEGGAYADGTVFTVSTTGTENVLYSFHGGRDGANPRASLLAVKGVLYGTTEYGGATKYANAGTVFRMSMSGTERVLHRFHGHYELGHYYYDGANPVASLIDVKGKLYGTTTQGGDYPCVGEGCGTVYSISKNGAEKVLHDFAPYTDGSLPMASLIDVKGTLYGTTELGQGALEPGPGAVFSISTTGSEKVLYNFGSDGSYPQAGLININGTLYGTTMGGAYGGSLGGGTAFSITTSGSLTTLHFFGSGSDGSASVAPLLYVNGALYGTTSSGGTNDKGTVFRMSLAGTDEEVLHSFGHGFDGATPLAGLVDLNGTLYGTTSAGGENGKGTVFALTP